VSVFCALRETVDAFSSFFKPMNGVILPPSDSADRKPHVVKLDYESTIIVHFLDCASVSSPILSTEFDDSVKLLGLADQLQAEKLVNLVKQHLGQKIKDGHRAADLLLSASTRDDWALGRAAIRKLNQNTIEELNRQPGGYEGFFDKLRPVWRQNLMKLVLFQMLRDVGPHWMGWTGLAGRFVAPDRNTEKRRSR